MVTRTGLKRPVIGREEPALPVVPMDGCSAGAHAAAMRLLLLFVLCGVSACGGAPVEVVEPQRAAASPVAERSPDGWPAVSDEEVKRGCLSFIESVHDADSNEVYDAGTGVLQVYVGQQRFLLSKDVQECRDNSLAMERLKFAEAAEASNGNSTSPSPYPWTDCNAFRPGDPLDFSDTQCNYEVVQFFTVDCVNGTYVHLSRPQLGDLEGIDGVTPWREAAPVDPKRRLTDWAFENCKEHG